MIGPGSGVGSCSSAPEIPVSASARPVSHTDGRVGASWAYLLPEPEVAANEAQWHRDPEPQEQKREQCPERHSAGGAFAPHEEVQEEEHHEHHAREEDCSLCSAGQLVQP